MEQLFLASHTKMAKLETLLFHSQLLFPWLSPSWSMAPLFTQLFCPKTQKPFLTLLFFISHTQPIIQTCQFHLKTSKRTLDLNLSLIISSLLSSYISVPIFSTKYCFLNWTLTLALHTWLLFVHYPVPVIAVFAVLVILLKYVML